VFVVRYEQLLDDATSHVQRIAEYLGIELSTEVAEAIVSRNSFEVVAGRKRGDEDPLSFYRKGLAGDWKNHFTTEAAYEFSRYAGDALVELGYEPDNSWISGVFTS
jgi:lipopolysaccharide transport system ATP-binding protein